MDSPDSPKSQRRPELASPAAAAPAWRKYFTRQRLRLFLILSVAAHLILGLSWGVPAYLKDKRLAAALVQQQKAREEAKRGAEQAVAVAKKKNLQTSVDEVKQQAKKSFDAITSDLKRPDKEKVWSTVEPKLQPTEQLLATAMGDRSMTDQDLRNLQAALNRELIEAVNQTLSANSAQDEINSFLNDVGARVAPELINHYRDGLTGKVAQPVRGAADAFVGATRDETARAVTALDPVRRTASDAVNTLRDALDSAGGAADRAAQAGDPKYAAEQAHQADLQLTRAAAAQDAADGAIAKLVEGAKPLAGNGELLARLKSTVKSLETTRAAIKPAHDAHAAANYANCARELTAASLTARKLGAETNAAMDVYGQGPYTAELAARGSIAALKDKAIPEQVNEKLTKGFAAQAADRIVEALGSGLIKRLGSSGIKAEPAQIAAARSRAKEILVAKVSEVTDYGASTTRYLNDPAGSSVAADGVDRLTDQLKTTTTPIIDRGVNETLADAALDAHLGNLVERPAQDPGRNDVQDRVAMLAARAADGRSGELDRVSFNDLRENALARAAAMDRISDPAKVAVATEPTTAPVADAPPVVEDIRKDIQRALQRELDKLLEGKLAAEKAAKVSEQVAKATDAAISRLAQDVIDPNVSDSDLENRRLDFSGKFLDAVHGALDKTASADVAKELLQKLSGQTGDAIAENYRNAVKDNVGNPLAREWRAETDRERHAAEQRVRDIRVALDSTKSVAEKAAQVLDQVKDQAARASADAKDKPDAPQKAIADGQAKLKEVSAAVASARADLEKAQKDVPADAAELKVRLKEIAAGVSQVDAKVKDAASKPASAAEFDKSVADARAEVEKFRGTLNGGDAAVNEHTEQAEATFLKAAQSVKDGDGKSAPGVKSKVQEELPGSFAKRLSRA